jgi:hypothetical protein
MRNATILYVMSVLLLGTARLTKGGFSCNLMWGGGGDFYQNLYFKFKFVKYPPVATGGLCAHRRTFKLSVLCAVRAGTEETVEDLKITIDFERL